MRRAFLLLLAGLVLSAGRARATNIWLSTSESSSLLGEVPEIVVKPGANDQRIHVWARPDPGKTLTAWSLNLRSTNADVISFENLAVYNPTKENLVGPFGSMHKRYCRVADSNSSTARIFQEHFQRNFIEGFMGFSFNELFNFEEAVQRQPDLAVVYGDGLSSESASLDKFYDPTNNAWLLATATYDVIGNGKTDLFLQIGTNGIMNAGESTGDHFVVFGSVSDPALRGGPVWDDTGFSDGDRLRDSATADATIVVVGSSSGLRAARLPEPSTFAFAVLGTFSLMGFAFRRQRHAGCPSR